MRKIIILLIIAFTFLDFQQKTEQVEFKSEQIEDINEIVQTITNQDNLNILKTNSGSRTFCTELKKITIEFGKKQKNGKIYPPPHGKLYLYFLLNQKINGEIFFSSKDSSNIMLQNLNPERLKIKETITDKLNSTSFEKEMIKQKNGNQYDFYEMTIPIFSLDRQKAYVELDHYCGFLGGGGIAIYLKKINGKWKIVEKWRTWIS